MAGQIRPTTNRSGFLFPSGARGTDTGVSFSRTAGYVSADGQPWSRRPAAAFFVARSLLDKRFSEGQNATFGVCPSCGGLALAFVEGGHLGDSGAFV